MYYAYIESEALKNPLILNNYKPVKIEIEFVPTSQTHSYVHAYYLKFEDDKVLAEAKRFARATLPEWYLLFWSKSIVLAIFKEKVFKLHREKFWQSPKYKEVQRYSIDHGIGVEYMDFNKNFKRFLETLAK